MTAMRSVNPATGETIRDHPEPGPAEVEERLALAARTFEAWSRTPIAARADLMRRAARVLREDRDRLARLMTEEMGKTIVAAEAEVDKCGLACDWFAEHAEGFLAPEPVASDAARSAIRYEPLGVILAVMPWNFPLWQALRAAVPALMAGNVVVLKHASNVPGCALAIEQVFARAGFPPGAFTTLLLPAARAEALVDHQAIRAVTLTGSEEAGRRLGARAAAALKKTVLELGGSDPFLVLADADPEAVAAQAVAARVQNNGQSCIAAKRFIVETPIAERFERAFAERMAALRVGDPLERAIQVGPLARDDLRDTLDRQVRDSLAAGARLLVGGERRQGPGFYYSPTVLAGVTPGMPAFDEETFGPVAAVTRARDVAEAVAFANRSRYGLGASVWTADRSRGESLARDLEAGLVFVNGIVKSDPRLPFGGVKASGYGRELAAIGIREFVNVKTVWVG
ncbi:MAG: NAD-dependent succinate-semialdehyde dehydrogenase [Candidatus Eiseniibacteriota bacterium]